MAYALRNESRCEDIGGRILCRRCFVFIYKGGAGDEGGEGALPEGVDEGPAKGPGGFIG